MEAYLFHPIFVHFTAALLFLAAALFLLGALVQRKAEKQHLLLLARWSLWIGTGMTIFTVASGLYAYNTVPHTEAAHEVMEVHRNWALSTAAAFLVLALWSYRHYRMREFYSLPFVLAALVAAGMLGMTGYLGGELVFKHGVGVQAVMSAMPKEGGHHHDGTNKDHHHH